MRGCGGAILKYLVFFTNLLVFLCGLVTLGYGIYALVTVDNNDLERLLSVSASLNPGSGDDAETLAQINDDAGAKNKTPEIILVSISGIIVLVSFLGCCGAWQENRFVIFLYYLVMLLITLAAVVGSTLAFDKEIRKFREPLFESMNHYNKSSKDLLDVKITEQWDKVQTQFSCCGVDSYSDWRKSGHYPDYLGHSVPDSCCLGLGLDDVAIADCKRRPYDKKYELEGCFSSLVKSYKGSERAVGIATEVIVAALVLNLIVIFGFGLCLVPKNAYQEV